MYFEIAAELLETEEVFSHLDALVERVDLHRISMDPVALTRSRWARGTRPQLRRLMVKALGAPIRRRGGEGPSLHRKRYEVCDEASAEVARRLALSPLIVLVEDEEADGRFLEIVIEELGGELRDLWRLGTQSTPPGVEFRSASLSLMPARVRSLAAQARREGRPVRLLAIHDSDRRWPGDEHPKKAVDAVATACHQAGAPAPHRLKKRSIENYVPDPVFRVRRSDPEAKRYWDAIDALLALNPTQRDHFPMKDKLTPAESDHPLYAGATLDPLQGANVLFPKRPRPILQLLDLGLRGQFSAEGLRARDGEGEWALVLQRIADEL